MDDKDLQELLDHRSARFGVAGSQLAIYDGLSVREFSSGFRNLELGLPVTHDTLFQIGSTTKLFNAALAMSLVDEGKLHLHAPVRDYVSDLRLSDPDAQEPVTLRHLLSMSAGLDNGPYHDYGRGDDALGRYVDVLAGIPQVFEPGSAFGYSNASSNVAGHVAARVMGKSWEQLLIERIWKPLQLKRSALFAEDLLLHPVALGYKKAAPGSAIQRAPVWCLPRSLGPAGGLTCCSAGDLISLARMFLDRGTSTDGTRIVSEAAIELMQQPQVRLATRLFADEWCIGPYRKRWGELALYGHSGSNFSGSSMLVWCPEKNMAIATVVNVSDQGYLVADAIFDEVFPSMFGIRKPETVTPDNVIPSKVDLKPYVGRFEAFGMTQRLEVDDGRLMLTALMKSAPHMDTVGCELIPLGEGRFLPRNPNVSANRNWDLAFWGTDASGRASHLLHGIFPLRRTG